MRKARKIMAKTTFLWAIIIMVFFSLQTKAQAPAEFNYQAAARDAQGKPLVERDIKVRLTIRNASAIGNAEYSEIRKLHTNAFGMFTISIGSPDAFFSTGSLSDVEWANGKKWLQVEIDINGTNNYVDLGATQLLSVPYALFALKTVEGSGGTGNAGNGLSISDGKIQLGNNIGQPEASLEDTRIIPLNKQSVIFKDDVSEIKVSKHLLSFQQDSTQLNETIFMRVDPIFPRPDALPFLFNRRATKQHNGTVSPNEVVMWGHNLAGGGSAYIAGLPAIGYSIESNYKPLPDDRYVESHEFYVTPQGQQIRLKSYTINTKTNHIDFYHTSDNFYIKNPQTGTEYFSIATTPDNSYQQITMGVLRLASINASNVVQFISTQPNGELDMQSNWSKIHLPGVVIEPGGLIRMSGIIIPASDSVSVLGIVGSRFANISSVQYQGGRLVLKENWVANENIQPTSTADITGTNGYNQLRLRKSYTPSNSSDPNGNIGDLAWDDDYIYIKTNSGWKRTALSGF